MTPYEEPSEDFVADGLAKIRTISAPFLMSLEANPFAPSGLAAAVRTVEAMFGAFLLHLADPSPLPAVDEEGRDETSDVVDGQPAPHMVPETSPAGQPLPPPDGSAGETLIERSQEGE